MPLDRQDVLLRKAKQDELVLERLLDDRDVDDDTLGFHERQAAEKLLKAANCWPTSLRRGRIQPDQSRLLLPPVPFVPLTLAEVRLADLSLGRADLLSLAQKRSTGWLRDRGDDEGGPEWFSPAQCSHQMPRTWCITATQRPVGRSSPRSKAFAMAPARSSAPSFSRMARTWNFTVRTVMPRLSPIAVVS